MYKNSELMKFKSSVEVDNSQFYTINPPKVRRKAKKYDSTDLLNAFAVGLAGSALVICVILDVIYN